MKRVIIAEAQLKQYRLPFYARLYQVLQADGIDLRVAYSDPPPSEARKNDTRELPRHYGFRVNGYWVWPEKLLYQPLLGSYLGSDLVVADEGNRYILNHVLMGLSLVGLKQVAFWGLADNRRQGRLRLSESYRRATLNWVDHWFAYTKRTASYLESAGVPDSKITVVWNSVDTREIQECGRSVTGQDRATLRLRLGIPADAAVGIFCGILQEDKCLPLLIESSRIIRERMPRFHLIIVGAGGESDTIHRMVDSLSWIHMVGPRFGKEKAELLAIADVFLLPGRVGLAILDAFAAGIPMITTRLDIHGPEVEYLEEESNGLISDHDPVAYAHTVCSLFSQPERIERLRVGAIASCGKYSIENMVTNFAEGIRICLGVPQGTSAWPQPADKLGVMGE